MFHRVVVWLSLYTTKTKRMKNSFFSLFFTSSLKVKFGCETLKIHKCRTTLTNFKRNTEMNLGMLYISEKLYFCCIKKNLSWFQSNKTEVKQTLFLLLVGKWWFLDWPVNLSHKGLLSFKILHQHWIHFCCCFKLRNSWSNFSLKHYWSLVKSSCVNFINKNNLKNCCTTLIFIRLTQQVKGATKR